MGADGVVETVEVGAAVAGAAPGGVVARGVVAVGVVIVAIGSAGWVVVPEVVASCDDLSLMLVVTSSVAGVRAAVSSSWAGRVK